MYQNFYPETRNEHRNGEQSILGNWPLTNTSFRMEIQNIFLQQKNVFIKILGRKGNFSCMYDTFLFSGCLYDYPWLDYDSPNHQIKRECE